MAINQVITLDRRVKKSVLL